MSNKTLMLYFSRSGQNWIASAVRYTLVGNTEIIAAMCKNYLGDRLDIIKVEPLEPYADSYSATTERIKYEIDSKCYVPYKLPNLSIREFAMYNTVIIAYPIYYGHMPPPFKEVLHHFKLDNKKVIPIVTHEGSYFGESLTELQSMYKNMILMYGKSFEGHKLYDLFTKIYQEADPVSFVKLCQLIKNNPHQSFLQRELEKFLDSVIDFDNDDSLCPSPLVANSDVMPIWS